MQIRKVILSNYQNNYQGKKGMLVSIIIIKLIIILILLLLFLLLMLLFLFNLRLCFKTENSSRSLVNLINVYKVTKRNVSTKILVLTGVAHL